MPSNDVQHTRLLTITGWMCLVVYSLLLSVGVWGAGIWGILGIALSIVLFGMTWWGMRRVPRPDYFQFGMAVVFLVGAAILNLFSIDSAISWHKWKNLLTILIPLSLLSAPAIRVQLFRKEFFTLLPCIAGVAALLLGLELYSGAAFMTYIKGDHGSLKSAMNDYNRPFSYMVLMVFPLAAAIWHSPYRRWLALFAATLLIPTALSESSSAQLSLMLGVGAAIAATVLPRLTRYGLSVASLLVIGVPFAMRWVMERYYDSLHNLQASWRHRVEILDYVSYRILEHPWMGWGLGSSRFLSSDSPHAMHYAYALKPAGHPHNMMAQIWVELGIFGLVVAIVFQQITLRRAAVMPGSLAPFAIGAWAVAFGLSLTAYDLWTDSLFAAFALTGLAFAGLRQRLQAGK